MKHSSNSWFYAFLVKIWNKNWKNKRFMCTYFSSQRCWKMETSNRDVEKDSFSSLSSKSNLCESQNTIFAIFFILQKRRIRHAETANISISRIVALWMPKCNAELRSELRRRRNQTFAPVRAGPRALFSSYTASRQC